MKVTKFFRALLWVQAVYYTVTALWGLLHIESFMAVTGQKLDIWLVKTVSVLIIPIAVCLFCGLFLNTHPLLLILVAGTAALGFACIDFYYTANKTIRWVYAVDGVVQSLFVIGWFFLFFRRRRLVEQLSTPLSATSKS